MSNRGRKILGFILMFPIIFLFLFGTGMWVYKSIDLPFSEVLIIILAEIIRFTIVVSIAVAALLGWKLVTGKHFLS